MARRGSHGGRGRPVTVESLWKLTLVAAVVVGVAMAYASNRTILPNVDFRV